MGITRPASFVKPAQNTIIAERESSLWKEGLGVGSRQQTVHSIMEEPGREGWPASVGPRSQEQWRRARARVAGASSSPARDYGHMGLEEAIVGVRGQGAYLWDVDGRRYLDYLQSYGAGILGHGRQEVTQAVVQALKGGPLWGVPCEDELKLADELAEAIPWLERIRFVSTGTEALMSVARLARAATGRDLLVKFDAGYHGHSDAFLGETGSAAAHAATTLTGDPGEAAGVPDAVRRLTVTLPWGDIPAFRQFMAERGKEVAAVVAEPVAANIGICLPAQGFLEALRAETDRYGALLVLDEVITAFRFRYGSISQALGVKPDLIALGKLIGGGLPIGAYGGRADLMALLSPEGPVFQAGTHAGNPATMAAGLATLKVLRESGTYERLDQLGALLEQQMRKVAAEVHEPIILHRLGGAITMWFGEGEVTGPDDIERTDLRKFAACFRALLRQGVLTAPSPYEVWFLSLAHQDEDVEVTGRKLHLALQTMECELEANGRKCSF